MKIPVVEDDVFVREVAVAGLEVAEATQQALHMSHEERVARWQAMLNVPWASDVSQWAASFIKDLPATRQAEPAARLL